MRHPLQIMARMAFLKVRMFATLVELQLLIYAGKIQSFLKATRS